MNEQICFRDFMNWHRRSGGGLVAESDVSREIENRFGKFYVSHAADSEILTTLYGMIGKEVFLLEIIGVPGVGKTKLLKELVEGLDPKCFEEKYQDCASKVKNAFKFLNVEKIGSVRGKTISKSSSKALVWVTLNIDEFVSIGKGINPLRDLLELLDKNLKKGESLIICGNVGVLEDKKARDAIHEICKLIEWRNQREIKYVRFPPYESLYWTKEYGIHIERYGIEGDPSSLLSGPKGFQDYSLRLAQLGLEILQNCLSNAHRRDQCKECIGSTYLDYLKRLSGLLKQEDFVDRLHDLMEYLWLKYPDIYLVARTINIFWGYTLTGLWNDLENRKSKHEEKLDNSILYQALYLSKLPSIYDVSEYELFDTAIHRFRDSVFESEVLSSADLHSLKSASYRLRKRLLWFFERLKKSESREMIHGGVFEEYMNQDKLASCLTDIAKRLIFMRLDDSLIYIPESDERFKELNQDPWGFQELVLASKVIGVQKEGRKTTKIPLLMFNESVLNDVSIQSGVAFEEIQRPAYYLTNREKIIALKLRLGSGIPHNVKDKAPRLHLNLMNYNSLRNLTKGLGRPDISLYRSTLVKVHSFLDEIEGFVTHVIRPLLWKYLRSDIKKGDMSRILIRTLGPNTIRCTAKIVGEHLIVEKEGVEIFRWNKKGFQ